MNTVSPATGESGGEITGLSELDYLRAAVDEERDLFVAELSALIQEHGLPAELLMQISDSLASARDATQSLFFLAGYFGNSQRAANGLFRAALAVELINEAIITHHDVADRWNVRRDRLPMHTAMTGMFALENPEEGRSLALLTGDAIYASAIDAFLGVRVEPELVQMALRTISHATVLAGAGRFKEILLANRRFGEITPEEVAHVYELKTGHYSFAAPLSSGATLAGAPQEMTSRLYEAGVKLGVAFQLADDYAQLTERLDQREDTCLRDLSGGIKTLPILLLSRRCTTHERMFLERLDESREPDARMVSTLRELVSAKRLDRIVGVYVTEQRDKALEILSDPATSSFQSEPLLADLITSVIDQKRKEIPVT